MSKLQITENIAADDLFPSLRELLKNESAAAAQPDLSKLSLANNVDEEKRLLIPKREDIEIVYGGKVIKWRNDSIRALFRGNRIPPDLEQFPPEYQFFFFRIEQPVATFSKHQELALNDAAFEEIFSAMRRRPDGRRINLMHDLIWQAAAFASSSAGMFQTCRYALFSACMEGIISTLDFNSSPLFKSVAFFG